MDWQGCKPKIDSLSDIYQNIRELASQALHNLTPSDPEYMAKTVFPKVLLQMNNIDLNTRHGCILGCSEVIHALFLYAKETGRLLTNVVDKDCFEIVKDFVPQVEFLFVDLGLGGDYMRQAVCHLIMKLSLSELPWHGDQIIGVFQDTIDDNLSHTEPVIQEGAVRALGALCQQYYVKDDGGAIDGIQDRIITHYVGQLKSPSEFSRVGFAQALGFLPKFMLSSRLKVAFTGLITASQVADDPGKFAESRREALNSLARIACTVGLSRTGDEEEIVTESSLHELYEAFFVAMNDYTIDSRGDVGAWVREASMSGLETLTRYVAENDPSLFTPEICERVMCCLAQQSSEKIDRTRAHAGEIFLRLLYMDSPTLPHIPHHKELLDIFPKDKCLEMNWSASAECFPRITKLLGLASYRRSVLLGLTVSVGGLTESLMLDMLFANGCFELFTQDESHPFSAAVLDLTKKEIFKIGDARKLITSVSVFCGLLQFPGVTRMKAFQQLSIFLCHRYPQVRKTTADHLYSAVLTYDDIIPAENLDEVLTILTETSWDAKIEELRVIRNRLCDIMGIPHPVLKSSTAPTAVKKKKDELDSYKGFGTDIPDFSLFSTDLVSRGY
ncbi:hypothetical protein pdam_00008754 [Pocillopora damicornis]|uniref:Tubulin-specific chaperone D n=1 Tax=Pocillopora damicornis TaxID=46731 RepID=A0A3M6UAD9_POCDA|nr:hypothetical protein pdam_00008754 [Pocillopora damicornis]